jgi:uncharacterized coiled-coil protein SlyX
MPLPLILIGIAVVSGLFGAGSGVKAVVKNKEANDTNDAARRVFDSAKEKLEKAKGCATLALEEFGKQKISTWTTQMADFEKVYSKIKNVKVGNRFSKDGFLPPSKDELLQIKQHALNCQEILSGGFSTLGAGALTGFGAYGGATMLATASTGTAISTLSGVAATNATLAWFGGGSLAAGGLGMAGGAIVLGGLVSGPALLVGGLFMNSAASKRLAMAEINYYEAKKLAEEMNCATTSLDGIVEVVNQYAKLLKRLAGKMLEANQSLAEIIRQNGNDYRSYDLATKRRVLISTQMAQLLSGVLNTSVLTSSGALADDVQKKLEGMQNKMDGLTEDVQNKQEEMQNNMEEVFG